MTARTVYRGAGTGLAEAPEETTAMHDLAATMLDDAELVGPALVLLAGQQCQVGCPPGRSRHRLRRREFGPLE